jgi:hypothetical protein
LSFPQSSWSTGGRNRTCGLLINSEAHEPAHASPVRKMSGFAERIGAAGIEPAISCSRSRRIPAFLRPGIDQTNLRSAQRESNPHVRHGEAVGFRYIMGTSADAELSKNPRAPGGTRTHVSALRGRCLRLWTTSAEPHFGVGPEGLEPSPVWLRARCSAARALVPRSRCR